MSDTDLLINGSWLRLGLLEYLQTHNAIGDLASRCCEINPKYWAPDCLDGGELDRYDRKLAAMAIADSLKIGHIVQAPTSCERHRGLPCAVLTPAGVAEIGRLRKWASDRPHHCAQCWFWGIKAPLRGNDCTNPDCVLYKHGHKARPEWMKTSALAIVR